MFIFINLKNQIWHDDDEFGKDTTFAFYDTVINKFVELSGSYTFSSVKMLSEYYNDDDKNKKRTIDELIKLIPSDYFNKSEDKEYKEYKEYKGWEKDHNLYPKEWDNNKIESTECDNPIKNFEIKKCPVCGKMFNVKNMTLDEILKDIIEFGKKQNYSTLFQKIIQIKFLKLIKNTIFAKKD